MQRSFYLETQAEIQDLASSWAARPVMLYRDRPKCYSHHPWFGWPFSLSVEASVYMGAGQEHMGGEGSKAAEAAAAATAPRRTLSQLPAPVRKLLGGGGHPRIPDETSCCATWRGC